MGVERLPCLFSIMAEQEPILSFVYRNHRGQVAIRRVRPLGVPYWGSTPYYPQATWLMTAWDMGRDAQRDFALCNIVGWVKWMNEPLQE
jgi:predicted DNA-binding transcriptional regulator YafY